ncbi:MAG: universal stress protein [Ilumatobacteraceae bacterium]
MSNKIIVGFKGIESSSGAVQWAANEARARHAELHIVSCYEYPSIAAGVGYGVDYGAGATYDVIRSTAAANAAEIRASIDASHPDVMVSVDVVPGPATMVLLDGLDDDDVVVVGASSHDGAAAFWLGTTPRHLVHNSPCPVAVIRGSVGGGAPDRVIVGVDGSRASGKALRWAGDEADRHGAELVVVHAWDYPYDPTDTASVQGRDLTEIDAACTLDRAVETARERFAAVVTPTLVEGGPVMALLETARDGDILVLGSRGRGALRSRIFGSTANSILDAAAVPVVIVRTDPDDDHSTNLDAEHALATA